MVLVDVVETLEEDDIVVVAVVVGSRQPNQPGVLQVSVRVYVVDVVVDVVDLVVVISDPLL